MIRTISGRISWLGAASVVVETGGIGYLVRTNARTETLQLDDSITLHTHLAVRENALDLYGFQSLDELELFELLLTIPKVGPKTALQILLHANSTLIKEAVSNNDPGHLSKLSGLGKKSAEKIVAGLKDKLDLTLVATKDSGAELSNSFAHDTIDALIALGYREEEARRAVRQLAETNPEITTSPEALKAALRLLSR